MNQTPNRSGRSALSPEDLLILERRGMLTESERRRLHMCLASSDSLRVLRQMGRVFDAMSHVTPMNTAAEAQLTNTITQLACARRALPTRRRRSSNVIRALAAVTLLASLAAAGAALPWHRVVQRFARAQAPGQDTRIPPAGLGAPLGSLSAQAPVPSREHVDSAEIQSASALPSVSPGSAVTPFTAVNTSRVHEAAPGGAQTDPQSSAQLFSAANSLRREGQLPRASALYRLLQHQFPRSDEARLSYVMLARLELARGAAGQALAEFNNYLSQVPGGTLEQEALQGKAEALSRMGRTQEQRAVLNELRTRYPNSLYAVRAREQLAPK